MWLREIARQTAAGPGCLEVIGHASPSGPAEANLRLSQQRAERVRDRLVAMQPGLGGRLASRGAGASEPIIGSGADDASDLLDRRVEFRPVACTVPPS
nr:OmpA family protein [Roseomonas mucosa]